MKSSILSLLVVTGLAHATPPVLSFTQAALQKIDPDIKPDHYDIARTDLNADGKEDVLALMNGKSGYRGSGGATMFILKGTTEGFESLGSIKVVNKKKSMSQITLPELGENAKGYRGGDEFAVVEGILGRRFPIYPDDKPESKPTGKIRQIQYKLHQGEAGWLLKPDKVVEF